jgi:hypothetical protein
MHHLETQILTGPKNFGLIDAKDVSPSAALSDSNAILTHSLKIRLYKVGNQVQSSQSFSLWP